LGQGQPQARIIDVTPTLAPLTEAVAFEVVYQDWFSQKKTPAKRAIAIRSYFWQLAEFLGRVDMTMRYREEPRHLQEGSLERRPYGAHGQHWAVADQRRRSSSRSSRITEKTIRAGKLTVENAVAGTPAQPPKD
jgi:hypothetical protein